MERNGDRRIAKVFNGSELDAAIETGVEFRYGTCMSSSISPVLFICEGESDEAFIEELIQKRNSHTISLPSLPDPPVFNPRKEYLGIDQFGG